MLLLILQYFTGFRPDLSQFFRVALDNAAVNRQHIQKKKHFWSFAMRFINFLRDFLQVLIRVILTALLARLAGLRSFLRAV